MSKENIYIKRVSNLRELMRQKILKLFVTHDDEHLLENTSKVSKD